MWLCVCTSDAFAWIYVCGMCGGALHGGMHVMAKKYYRE